MEQMGESKAHCVSMNPLATESCSHILSSSSIRKDGNGRDHLLMHFNVSAFRADVGLKILIEIAGRWTVG